MSGQGAQKGAEVPLPPMAPAHAPVCPLPPNLPCSYLDEADGSTFWQGSDAQGNVAKPSRKEWWYNQFPIFAIAKYATVFGWVALSASKGAACS